MSVSETIVSCDRIGIAIKTPINIVLKSNKKGAIKRLDGLKIRVLAKASDQTEGIALNKNQTVQFTNIVLRIKGNININLNK